MNNMLKSVMISPFVAPIILCFLQLINWATGYKSYYSFLETMHNFGLIFLIGLPASYLALLILGLPSILLLKRMRILGKISVSITGFIQGSILYTLFEIYIINLGNNIYPSTTEYLSLIAIGGILGLSVAFTFSLISRITSI